MNLLVSACVYPRFFLMASLKNRRNLKGVDQFTASQEMLNEVKFLQLYSGIVWVETH